MAKQQPKTAADRVRVCGKWQEKGYKASDEEKAAYAERMGATRKAAETKPNKKK